VDKLDDTFLNEKSGVILEAPERAEAREIMKSKQTLYDLVKYYKSHPRPPKVETGVSELDNHFNGGLEMGQLIGIGGQPEAGKSILLEKIIGNVSSGFKSLYYTLEFSPREYAERNMPLPQYKNILVDPETYLIDDIEKDIKLLAKYEGVKFVVIDSQMKLRH
jgi:predicted ATP-dependent serine protease